MNDPKTRTSKDPQNQHYQFQYEQGPPLRKPIENSRELHKDLKQEPEPVTR
jgi:hypothetical protein